MVCMTLDYTDIASDHDTPSALVDTAYPPECRPVATNTRPFQATSIAPPEPSNTVLVPVAPVQFFPSELYAIVYDAPSPHTTQIDPFHNTLDRTVV